MRSARRVVCARHGAPSHQGARENGHHRRHRYRRHRHRHHHRRRRRHRRRRYFSGFVGAILGLCSASPATAAAATTATAPTTTPNVILILADDLGYGDVGCYGANKVRTPHIDRLAREGRRFTDAHSTSAVCTPSRYALLTGEYPFRRGLNVPVFLKQGLVIDPERTTLADVMQQAVRRRPTGTANCNPVRSNSASIPFSACRS